MFTKTLFSYYLQRYLFENREALGTLQWCANNFGTNKHIRKDALRSIVISQRLLGTREIAVFHHTDCGMLTFNTPQLRDIVKKAEPDNAVVAREVDAIEFLEFPDAAEAVKRDVQYLKEHPLVLKGTEITGWLYDVKVCG